MRLNKDDAFLWVNACRQPVKHHFVNIFPKGFRILQSRESMNIHDAIDAVIFILEGNVILHRSQIVSDVLSACRSRTGENAFSHFLWRSLAHRRSRQQGYKEVLGSPHWKRDDSEIQPSMNSLI